MPDSHEVRSSYPQWINGGYYMPARGYEFQLSSSVQVRYLLEREKIKIRIHKRARNIQFIIYSR